MAVAESGIQIRSLLTVLPLYGFVWYLGNRADAVDQAGAFGSLLFACFRMYVIVKGPQPFEPSSVLL